jgi:RNA polymerase sigma factor (sigma-70 family)
MMITEQDAQKLMIALIKLRKKAQETNQTKDIAAYRHQEQLCIEKFKHLIIIRAARYRGFSNYEDLVQEGYESLLRAMKNYDPKKGSWFYWAHKYIDTKIARMANAHTAIRYPIRVARETTPHRETELPIMVEQQLCPELQQERNELLGLMETALTTLPDTQKRVLELYYGFDGDRPLSISAICKQLQISRKNCLTLLEGAHKTLREDKITLDTLEDYWHGFDNSTKY